MKSPPPPQVPLASAPPTLGLSSVDTAVRDGSGGGGGRQAGSSTSSDHSTRTQQQSSAAGAGTVGAVPLHSLQNLLERQWEQTAQFILDQAGKQNNGENHC